MLSIIALAHEQPSRSEAETLYYMAISEDCTSDRLFCSEFSKQLNDSRIMILQSREDALQGIVKDVQSKLSQVSSNKKKYSSLLTDLILQVKPIHGHAGLIVPISK